MVNELTHHGVKGQRWGFRRFQNKDGSLTKAGKKRYGVVESIKAHHKKKKRQKQLAKAREAAAAKREAAKALEEERAKLLKSTDATEIYKNRDKLTTFEINERLNRINAEQRLADLSASSKPSAMDKVDKALKVARKINEVYEFTNTPVMKAVKKKLGLEKAEKQLGLEEAYKNRDKLSTAKLQEVYKKAATEDSMKRLIDARSEAAANSKAQKEEANKLANAQRLVDEYNKKWMNGESMDSVTANAYSKSGKELVDAVLEIY